MQPHYTALLYWGAWSVFGVWAVQRDLESLLNGWWMILFVFWFTANSIAPTARVQGRLAPIVMGLASIGAAFLLWGTYWEFDSIFEGLWVGPHGDKRGLFTFPIRGFLVSMYTAMVLVPQFNRIFGRYTVRLLMFAGMATVFQAYGSGLFNLKRWHEHRLTIYCFAFVVVIHPLMLAAFSERVQRWRWPDRAATRAIARVWNGELPVWVVILIEYPLTSAAVLELIRLHYRLREVGLSYWRCETLKAATWILMLLILIIGSTIAWRGLTRAQNQGIRFWHGVRWVVVLFASPILLVTLTSSGFVVGHTLTQSAAAALGGVYQITVPDRGVEMSLTGNVTFGLATQFADVLVQHPEVRRVRLESDGGDIREAMLTSQMIAAHQLDTVVDAECSSACTILFVSGNHRILGKNGKLGFHAAHSADPTEELPGSFVSGYLPFHVDGEFVKRVESVKPDDMWYPTKEELLRRKIVTEER